MSKENLKTERQVTPFAFVQALQEAADGLNSEIVDRMAPHRDQMVAPQNVLNYRHGRAWTGPTVPFADTEGEFVNHSSTIVTKFEDILKGDPSLLENTIQNITSSMNRSFSKMVFSKLDEATEKTGNIVQGGSEKKFPEIMIEMYERIKFGVDREGNISRPTMVTSPSQQEKFEREMAEMDEETAQKLKNVIAEREREALADEQARLSKFESTDDASE